MSDTIILDLIDRLNQDNSWCADVEKRERLILMLLHLIIDY